MNSDRDTAAGSETRGQGEDDRLGRRFARLSMISVLSNLTVPLVGLVDTAMLGHLEEIRFLAGVALASLLFDFLYWGFGFLRMSTTGLTAQATGRRDDAAANLVLLQGILIAFVLGLVIVLLQKPIEELGFWLLRGEPGVELAGRSYFTARVWGAPAVLCNYVLLGWLLGRERPGAILVVTVVGNLANVGLNWWFIMDLGLQARGAGLASMAGQYLALLTALVMVARARTRAGVALSAVLDRSSLFTFVRLNRDIFLRTICLLGSFACFTNLSSVLGTAALAANAILLRLLDMAAYLNDGAAFATESLAGAYVGARRPRDLCRLLRLSLIVGQLLALAFIVPLLVFPESLLGVLTSHREISALALRYLGWVVPALLFGSVSYQLDGFFIGLTEGGILRRSMMLSSLGVFLPIALLGWRLGNNDLLWLAMVGLNGSRALTLGRAAVLWFRRWTGMLLETTLEESAEAAS